MASILERMGTLMKANINDLLDKAEDPEKMLKQLIADMQEDLVEAKTSVARSIADEKKLYSQYVENQQDVDEWQQKAELAIKKGEDNLAKEALTRKKDYEKITAELKVQWDEQKKQVEDLKLAMTQLNNKIEEAERHKDLLIARHRRAIASKTAHETLSGISKSSALSAFERMKEKVETEEAQAQAVTELSTDTLKDKFAKLEEGTTDVDAELAALKEKMKGS